MEDTAAKRPKNCPNKVRKYEATYVEYGFMALQKNGLDCRHVIWLYSYSKNNAAIIEQQIKVRKKNVLKVDVSLHISASVAATCLYALQPWGQGVI